MNKFGILVVLLLISSCAKDQNESVLPSEELKVAELSSSLKEFQWHLFQKVVKNESVEKNLCISPLSIASALYLTYEGAAGETRKDISQTLYLPPNQTSAHLGQSYENLLVELTKNNTALSTANAVFWDKNRIVPKESFLNYASDYFQAGKFDLNFREPTALKSINEWVESSTKGRITKILEEISEEEVMFLINALYFKNDWQYPFALEATRKSDFSRTDGTVVQADLMHQDISTLRYYQANDFSAVELPFADTSYHLVLLLPPTGSSPDQLIAELNVSRLSKLFNQDLTTGRILLEVPRFEIEYKKLLNQVLKSMGMEVAFDPDQADFSNLGVAPEGNLFLSKVLHKTYLKIDEKGAEGAAVTSIGVGVTSLPPQLSYNRPFVYLLTNRPTGAIIFGGKVEDPTSKS